MLILFVVDGSGLTFDEREQFLINLLLVGGAHAVRCCLVNFECGVVAQSDRLSGRILRSASAAIT